MKEIGGLVPPLAFDGMGKYQHMDDEVKPTAPNATGGDTSIMF
jgi:hypothetical protein